MPIEPPDDSQSVRIHYIKSNMFRVAHADGAWGGLTPQGKIHLDFWSERHPIPKSIVYAVEDGEDLAKEVSDQRDSLKGLVREIEVGVVMDVAVAVQLQRWLAHKIAAAQSLADSRDSFPEDTT